MDIGFSELLILAFIGVVFLKPQELRAIAKKLGQWMGEMRKISREFTGELAREADLGDIREAARKIKQDIRDSINAIPDGSPQPVEIKKNPFIEENPHEPLDWTGGVGPEAEAPPTAPGSRAPGGAIVEPVPRERASLEADGVPAEPLEPPAEAAPGKTGDA